MAMVRLETSELVMGVADNEPFGEHRAGYHSLALMRHRSHEENLFVPAYCGVWFEHVVDGQRDDREWYFEPRRAQVELSSPAPGAACLHWPELPLWGLEARMEYRAVEPHFVDLTLAFTPRRRVALGPFLGFFFASYINHPEDMAIYFYGEDCDSGEKGLIRHCTPRHGTESTVRYAGAPQVPPFSPDIGDHWMYASFSNRFFAEPFFFGYWRDFVYSLMFAEAEGVWFAHSPSGGGEGCPAWDFVLHTPEHEVNTTYSFRMRLMLSRKVGASEIGEIYKDWRAGLAD